MASVISATVCRTIVWLGYQVVKDFVVNHQPVSSFSSNEKLMLTLRQCSFLYRKIFAKQQRIKRHESVLDQNVVYSFKEKMKDKNER